MSDVSRQLGVNVFGKHKKRLLDRMEVLVAAAQFVTVYAIAEAAGAYDATDEEAKSAIMAVAAAKANYLFAREPDDSHEAQFDLGELEREADAWLSQEEKMRELVVQSLRVQNMVAFGRTGRATEPLGSEILVKYGSRYPDAPDPSSYPALVRGSLNELNQGNRDGLLQSFERRGIHI